MLRFTARDWELFTGMKGVGKVATTLNKHYNALVKEAFIKMSKGADRDKTVTEVRDAMYKVMSRYSEFGACDTEPECHLCDALEKTFGGRVDRW